MFAFASSIWPSISSPSSSLPSYSPRSAVLDLGPQTGYRKRNIRMSFIILYFLSLLGPSLHLQSILLII